MKNKSVVMTKKDKNPKGGLTQAGRDKYNSATGGNLKPPVSAKEAAAKAMAKAAGRVYPNLIDNMRAAKKKK